MTDTFYVCNHVLYLICLQLERNISLLFIFFYCENIPTHTKSVFIPFLFFSVGGLAPSAGIKRNNMFKFKCNVKYYCYSYLSKNDIYYHIMITILLKSHTI